MNPRIKSMSWNIRKQKITMQNKKEKESKKLKIVKTAVGTTSTGPKFTS